MGSTVYGYPRQGPHRELKRAIEGYWSGSIDAQQLLEAASDRRAERSATMAAAGLTELCCNDFSLYDHVLDTAWMFGAIPERHRDAVPSVASQQHRLDRYFAMARGTATVEPLEMTKWFDTNYHYLVPELSEDQQFDLDASKLITELNEHREAGYPSRPVVLGPLSFVMLSKSVGADFDRLSLLNRLLPCYIELLGLLDSVGVEWVQLDEPVVVRDLERDELAALQAILASLTTLEHRPKLIIASYFGSVGEAMPILLDSAVDGLALDFSPTAAANVRQFIELGGSPGRRLMAGVVDGRNVWADDLDGSLDLLRRLSPLCGRLDVAASCSLVHVPIDLDAESGLDPAVRSWLAFARQKLAEITLLARAVAVPVAISEPDASSQPQSVATALEENRARRAGRADSPLTRVDAVRRRAEAVTEQDLRRSQPYEARRIEQRRRLDLGPLPTTTIGSFPQTAEVRRARSARRVGRLDEEGYRQAMESEIDRVIELQERIGLDVLVHGEPERNDMVQYFAEQLDGFLTTENGWVQSYGTRCVRPPILFGDVARPQPMTLRWARYAQRRSERPVKGMLTGPVTMLAWSFVRDDLPRAAVSRQVALALRDEVADLEAAGIGVIQVDEPALRETLPLREGQIGDYLRWAVDAFRLGTGGVSDETQIHTHMCYAEFSDILSAIIEMDADVISLEAARSAMSIVSELAEAEYPREVGPGVWDIHSPRVPSAGEIADRIRSAVSTFPADRIWVNPDCGLKTRGYAEVEATLQNLVAAARTVRAEVSAAAG